MALNTPAPSHICPVCAWPALDDPPSDASGFGSHEICPCCGTQFGYDDARTSHADLRQRWVQAGARWFSAATPPSQGWSAKAQLDAAFPDGTPQDQ